MEKYFKRTVSSRQPPTTIENTDLPADRVEANVATENETQSSEPSRKLIRLDENMNLEELLYDPGLRTPISKYHPNVQDKIRRAYLQKGPCQPRNHNFPLKKMGNQSRRFNSSWFNEFGSWLEYSIAKDAAFCLCCYLFRGDVIEQGGAEAFTVQGFTNWKTKSKLNDHVGGPNSAHNKALKMCEDLMNQNQHITTVLRKQSDQAKIEYRARLTASVDCIRFLLRQGLAFRGHDESEHSHNQGNFLELLQFLADHNEDVKGVVLQNAPENVKLISPDIQKDIVSACAIETTSAIIDDLGSAFFAILIDESRDISIKEQMAVALRYVNTKGCVVEYFLGIIHVPETNAVTLKKAIEALFAKYDLSISRLRGQGYDGASNMRGELNGLKALIMKDNEQAFYVHCFAHQLQLTLVAVTENHPDIGFLFNIISDVLNIVGGSCKRTDILRSKQLAKTAEAILSGELKTGRDLNQETSLKRYGDTRWGSHYGTLLNFILMFSSVVEVLLVVEEDGSSSKQRYDAFGLLEMILTFKFAFNMHLMRNVLGITDDLSKALQRKEQDIVNAMLLVKISKERLLKMRNDGWDSFFSEVFLFCEKHHIEIPKMEENYRAPGRSRRRVEEITNEHYYHIRIFYTVIDMQLQELNSRFDEVNTDLLLCMACLCPSDSFSSFDKRKLVHLAEFYPHEFSESDLVILDNQLQTFIIDMRSSSEFSNLDGIGSLAMKMVEMKKNILYPHVYLLLILALTLPVATATVERAFSAMHIVKNRLRNRMADEWTNDCLVTYIEKDIFNKIDNEKIIQRFQNMKSRRGQL